MEEEDHLAVVNLLVGIRRVKKTLGLVMGLLPVINLVGAMIKLVAGVIKARLLMKVKKMVVGQKKMYLMRIMDLIGARAKQVEINLTVLTNSVIGVIQMLPTRTCHLVGVVNSMQIKKLVGLEIRKVVGTVEKLQMAVLLANGGKIEVGKMG